MSHRAPTSRVDKTLDRLYSSLYGVHSFAKKAKKKSIVTDVLAWSLFIFLVLFPILNLIVFFVAAEKMNVIDLF